MLETLKIQRPPVSHRCLCGQADILVFPDTAGCLTWYCGCGTQRQIVFRKNDVEDSAQIDVEFRRAPMDHGCSCGRRDILVLPQGKGEMRWMCKCGKSWRMNFNKTSGEVFPIGE